MDFIDELKAIYLKISKQVDLIQTEEGKMLLLCHLLVL
jgi:hypothetical protein